MDFRELARMPLQEQMRLRLFDRDPAGRTIYLPFGSTNLLIRVAFVAPAGDFAERVLALHRGIEKAALAILVALVAAAGVAFQSAPDRALDALQSYAAVATVAFAAVLFLPQYLPSLVGWWVHRNLERAAPRTHAEVVRRQDELSASNRVLAAVAIVLLAVLGAEALFVVKLLREGHAGVAAVVSVSFLTLLAVLGTMPGVARLRRLRREHARLESVVRARTAELAEFQRSLEDRVQEQVRDIERLDQLRHFFAAPVAEAILGEEGLDATRVHRRELSVICVDLRGFTAFSETAEPEEVISVLRIYHAELGILVNRHQATLEHFAGDGALIFLNDPVEVDDHPRRALFLATELRAAMRPHLEEWRRNGFDLGMGAGVAVGYATIGAIGYEGRWEYAAIGNVCNLAARLCSEARDGQVVTTERTGARAGPGVEMAPLGERALKGFSKPVGAFDVLRVGEP